MNLKSVLRDKNLPE